MKQKSMILIVLAVVCGLGAMFMTSKLLADRQSQEEMMKVLVAKRNLDTGTLIKKPEDMFEEKEVPKETAPKNALTKFEEVKGRQLKIPRRAGDNITQDDLFDQNSPGLMGILPPGHRAVGIRVSSEQIASGFAAVPHSRIDIGCTVKCNNDKDCGSRIILQNVLVLASGQQTIRDDGGKPMLCDVITVALTPGDALDLEAARNKGSLSMYLRPFGESTIVNTGNHTYEGLISKKNRADDLDEAPKVPGSSVPELILPSGPAPTPVFEQPVDRNFVQRIKNDVTVKITYKRGQDGDWDTDTEILQPGSIVATPGVRTTPRPSTAAPAPADQKR